MMRRKNLHYYDIWVYFFTVKYHICLILFLLFLLMQIFRPYYVDELVHTIQQAHSKLIFLHGGRWSWKTTILKQILSDHSLSQKKYYFSFEDEIVAKKFKNADDFKWYMQIKYGINFYENNILLLNEIQYSKNFINVLEELLQDSDINTIIIVTGIIQQQSEEYQKILSWGKTTTITIHPLWFFDFLQYKNIHTTYLTLDNPSQIMFREIQTLLDEYLIWGWYPEVIKATTSDRKEHQLKAIIQKVYDKDVGFYFNGEEILVFQDLMEQLCHNSMQWFKYKTVAQELEISIPLLKRYINFFNDNCLIETLSYFYTNKTKELSHQETILIGDMGIFSYMTGNFGSKLHNIVAIKNFVYNEIVKNLWEHEQCFTYQKINNSKIDFIIQHEDGTLTPIIVSESNTNKPAKIFKWFHKVYGDRVRQYIKTTPLLAYQWATLDRKFLCIPHFMIQTVVWS